MEQNKYRFILAAALVAFVIIFGILQGIAKPKKAIPIKEKKSIGIEAKDKTDSENSKNQKESDKEWMPKNQIKEYQNMPDDNLGTRKSNLQITFSGYEEYPEAFSWMGEEEWERMQESLKRYLEKKGFFDVTEVKLHPDSIQEINAYERYLYMDINQTNEYTDRIVLKTICDTYKDTMRFAFYIQYGS